MQLYNDGFWDKVEVKDPASCWNWTAAKNKAGYGRVKIDGKLLLPHRVAYEKAYGKLPEIAPNVRRKFRPIIRHKCDNPSCCNPAHLEVGSYRDNAMDTVERGRHHMMVKKRARLNNEARQQPSLDIQANTAHTP